MTAPLDGTGPQCIRCLVPIRWEGTWTPFCSALCSCKAAREAMRAGHLEEMRGRKGWQKEGVSQ